jgi:RNA polymerase primary sigma factor
MFAWAAGHRKKYPIWLMRVVISQFSHKQDFGGATSDSPKITEVYVGGKYANNFIAQKVITSSRNSTLAGALAQVKEKLAVVLDSESTNFLISADVYNYRERTPQERRTRETLARQERARRRGARLKKTGKKKAAKKKTAKKTAKKKTAKKAAKKTTKKKTTRRRR